MWTKNKLSFFLKKKIFNSVASFGRFRCSSFWANSKNKNLAFRNKTCIFRVKIIWKERSRKTNNGQFCHTGEGARMLLLLKKLNKNSKANFQALKMCFHATLYLIEGWAFVLICILIQKRNMSFPVMRCYTGNTNWKNLNHNFPRTCRMRKTA